MPKTLFSEALQVRILSALVNTLLIILKLGTKVNPQLC